MKLKVLVISLVCVFAVALGGATICATMSRQEIRDYIQQTQTNYEDSKSASLEGINAIEIHSSSEQLSIIQTPNVDQIQADIGIETYGFHLPVPQYQLRMETHNSTLKIYVDRQGGEFILYGGTQSTMKIYLPQSYTGDLDLDADSGSILLDSLTGLRTIKLDLDSCSLENRGNLSAQNIEMDLDSLSANLTDVSGSIKVDLDSSEFNLSMAQVNGDILLQGDSCDTTLTIPQDTSAQADLRCEYGDLSSDFSLNPTMDPYEEVRVLYGVIGQGEHTIRCQMDYGSFALKQSGIPSAPPTSEDSTSPSV
nr:DUF4097 family beta strand repeat-containing protein [uncultured Solibaculum sp.]